MTQFQQNMGLDLRGASSSMGNMQYPNNTNSHNNAAANMMFDPNMQMQSYLTGAPR
jgi:putative hemolysin